jgi:hypothetical protein
MGVKNAFLMKNVDFGGGMSVPQYQIYMGRGHLTDSHLTDSHLTDSHLTDKPLDRHAT